VSQKLTDFYFDKFGNFRATLQKLSSFSAPKKDVVYDPTIAKLIVTQPNGEQVLFDVGTAYWMVLDKDGKQVPDPSVLTELEKKL